MNLATVLIPPETADTFSEDEYSSFFGVILGNDTNTVKSKLDRIFSSKELG